MEQKRDSLSEKREFIAIDYFKFIGALLVVAIHIPPFDDVNETFSYEFQQVFCRIAVPFFFLSSGFFLGKKLEDKRKIAQYLKHIAGMYLIWTILYFPQIIHKYWESGISLRENLKNLFLRICVIGSYIQLWYLLATLAAVGLLYFLITKCHITLKKVLILSAVLYGIGVLGNSYRELLYHIPMAGHLLRRYMEIFFTTRNGLFFGFFFVTAGYAICQNSHRIYQGAYWKRGLFFYGVMFVEEFVVKVVLGRPLDDMLFSTPFAAVPIFLAIVFLEVPAKYKELGRTLRYFSSQIFVLHLFVNFYLGKLLNVVWNWKKISYVHYGVVILASMAAAALIHTVKRYIASKKVLC